MSMGRPVSGDADMVGGAGTAGGAALWGPNPGPVVGTYGGWAAFGFGFVVTVVDVAARVVVVVGFGFGRVVVVVDVDVVVVGGGLTVSTRRKSTPQALPVTSRRIATNGRREEERSDMRWRWGPGAVMSTEDGTGWRPDAGGPPEGRGFPA
jgi:hypothetical protein